MRIFRWILILPGAVLLGMAGSLVGSIAATLFGQVAIDTAAAFLGAFVFVCAAGVLAPSHHAKVTLGAAGLVAIVVIFGFVLWTFTTAQDLANLSTRERLLTPLAQLLGALYALFILPPLMTPHTTLDRLWREIFTLGTLVALRTLRSTCGERDWPGARPMLSIT